MSFQIICEKKDIFASGCAVVRAFPLYSKKTCVNGTSDEANNVADKSPAIINVEFLVIQNNEVLNFSNPKYPIANHPELANVSETLSALAHGIQLAARIVDTPCNEMNVDHFIEVLFIFINSNRKIYLLLFYLDRYEIFHRFGVWHVLFLCFQIVFKFSS